MTRKASIIKSFYPSNITTMDLSETFNHLYIRDKDVLHDIQLLKFCKMVRVRNLVLP